MNVDKIAKVLRKLLSFFPLEASDRYASLDTRKVNA